MAILQEIEPMIPSDRAIEKSALPSMARELMHRASKMERSIPLEFRNTLLSNMLTVNAFHSNLIEGRKIHPLAITQALNGEFSEDPSKRELQQEALAHIRTQQWLADNPPSDEYLSSEAFIRSIHRHLYAAFPESLRTLGDAQSGKSLVVRPGELRVDGQDVIVGRHLPPEGSRLPQFMTHFSESYRFDRLKGEKRVIAAMAAHHRLMWIHPFPDGNGRVCRLFTDMLLHKAGAGPFGAWSFSRGLAFKNANYKAQLAQADMVRQGTTDGRGGRSEKALVSFCEFMLTTAMEQIDYSTAILRGKDSFQGAMDLGA